MLGISVLKGYQVEALEAVCLNKRDIRWCVCAGWEQKLGVFWSRPKPHRGRPRHCQWASSLVQRLWLARFVSRQSTLFGIGLKSPPWWRYGAVRLALTQWRCGSNSTTAFGVYPALGSVNMFCPDPFTLAVLSSVRIIWQTMIVLATYWRSQSRKQDRHMQSHCPLHSGEGYVIRIRRV